jgi:hypothetical protein
MKTQEPKVCVCIGLAILISNMILFAEPMSAAFTYQGRLLDDNIAADGLYDMQFKLYDDPNIVTGSQIGSSVTAEDIDVQDGYFIADLDFGSSAFDGNTVWLEIGIRPGDQNDPNVYTILSPRQDVAATPYAVYALSSGGFAVPLSLMGSSSDAIISGTNTGSGDGVYGEAADNNSKAIRGKATCTGDYVSYGGFFEADSLYSCGVLGKSQGRLGYGVYGWSSNASSGAQNYGGYFTADGEAGRGVYGEALDEGPFANYGGYFKSASVIGYGVYAEASYSPDLAPGFNYGGYFKSLGAYGTAVYGEASYSAERDEMPNYGGYFKAGGRRGRAVYGEAPNTDPIDNYGGYFVAAGDTGHGVFAEVSGDRAYAVHGKATSNSTSGPPHYAGYFEAVGDGYGVYAAGGAYGFAGYFDGKVYIGGSLGIGTTTPDYKIHILDSGDSILKVNSSTNLAGIHIASGGSGANGWSIRSNGVAPSNLEFYDVVQSLTRMLINVDGNVGIGTTTPIAKLQVEGDLRVSGNGDFLGSFLRTYGNLIAEGQVYNQGTEPVYINDDLEVNGTAAKPGGGSWSVLSDRRVKKNIRPLSSSLERLLKLKGVNFEYSDTSHFGYLPGEQIGMVAQEVEQVFPDWIDNDTQGYKTLTFRGFEALTVEALRELRTEKDAEIAALKKENENLKERVLKMELALAKLINTGNKDLIVRTER